MRERRQGWVGKSHRWILLCALYVMTLCVLVACKGEDKAAAPTGPVGKVTELSGSVTASGQELGQRALELGAIVHADDEIATADGAAVTIHLDHNEANWSLGGGMKVVVSSSAAFRAKKGASGAFDEAGEGKTVAAGRHTERQAGEDPSTVVAATEAARADEPDDGEAPGGAAADEAPTPDPEPAATAPKADKKMREKSSSKRTQSRSSIGNRSMPKPTSSKNKQDDIADILSAAPPAPPAPPRQPSRAAIAKDESSPADGDGAAGDSPVPSVGGMRAAGTGSGGGGSGPTFSKKASSKRAVAYELSISSGPLPKEVLQRSLRKRQSAFVYCAAPMSEALLVKVSFEVDKEGVVRGIEILQSPHLKLGNCVKTKVRSIKFPSLQSASKVQATLRFDPLK